MNPYNPPHVDETTSAPGEEWLQVTPPSLRMIGVGLGVELAGLLIMTVSLVLIDAAVIAAFRGNLPPTLQLLASIAGYEMIVAAILSFVGPLLCMAVPAETGARGFIVGAVFFQMPSIVFLIVLVLSPDRAELGRNVVLNLVVNATSLVAFVMFLLFMQKLAELIGRRRLANRANHILVLLVITLFVAGIMVLLIVAQVHPIAVLAASVTVLIGLIVLLALYGSLLISLLGALHNQTPPPSGGYREAGGLEPPIVRPKSGKLVAVEQDRCRAELNP